MKTNKELLSEIEDLKGKLEEAGVKIKPTKMDEILAIETETIDTVDKAVRLCEKATGRCLLPTHGPENIATMMDVKTLKSECGSLKEMMRELGAHVKRDYTFNSTVDFCNWMKPLFRDGFDNTKGSKRNRC